ncbi:MAG: nucleoside monophosphate kinase [Streptosporangiaceae bacterium]
MLLLAPPGAGKGTQGERLAASCGVRHIAAGDLLRAEAQAGTARRSRDRRLPGPR